jgi:3-oxoadipate enol-lactonase
MPTINANGIHMYYEVQGTGEPLVVINSLGIEMEEFSAVTKPLKTEYKVLTFDNRGSGRSDKPDGPYSIPMMAQDSAEVMQAAGFNNASVVGISLGGRIALELALQHPEMVNKLVLVSTGARIQHSWARSLLTHTPLQFIYRGKYPQPRYAFIRQREASANYDATARLSEIKNPTLIMHGRRDKVAPLAVAEELHNEIRGSKLLLFKGGHLFFLLREPQRFISSLSDFLNGPRT